MKNIKNPLTLAVSICITTLILSSCNNNNDSTTAPALKSVIASAANGGGEMLVDTEQNLTWVNDVELDTRSDGCVAPSPAAGGPMEPSEANARCENQTFGGFNDWRAPTTAELTNLITSAGTAGVTLNYLVASCPALVGTDGIVRTENANGLAATRFPNAVAGDVIAQSIADLGGVPSAGGVPAGVRCVRDGTDDEPTQSRFTFARASAADSSGRTLLDTETGLEWVNQTGLDGRGDGCVSPSPAFGGPAEPFESNTRCVNQNFAGHSDWRAPTGPEMSELIKAAVSNGVALKYLIASCPAMVTQDNFVRTENTNGLAATRFPNAVAGDVIGQTIADLGGFPNASGTGGVPAGVRCVRVATP